MRTRQVQSGTRVHPPDVLPYQLSAPPFTLHSSTKTHHTIIHLIYWRAASTKTSLTEKKKRYTTDLVLWFHVSFRGEKVRGIINYTFTSYLVAV